MPIEWEAALRRIVAGRKVVLAGGVPAVWAPTAPLVSRCGATDVLVVATEGTGAGSGPDVETVVVEPEHDGSLLGRMRAGEAVLHDPPVQVTDALARFDPDKTALVMLTFLGGVQTLDGRPTLAHRRPEWLRLEDKTLADALWDRAGVRRKQAAVVALGDAARAAVAIDEGAGTVWTADATEGFNGGASMVRWVVDDPTETEEFFAGHCASVRVMPFVDGIPCSIHGWVLPDGVATFRPVEMVTLRHGHRFVYSGCSTFWDPPAGIRDQMRSVARRVGETLRAEVGYRGVFTVDGVVDREGFWPTELNPRFGAGLNVVARGLPELPLTLIHDLTVAGADLGVSAAELEEEVLSAADEHRAGGTWRVVGTDVPVLAGRPLCRDADGSLRWADGDTDTHDADTRDGDDRDVAVVATVIAGNGFLRFGFDPAALPVGDSVGPLACEMWEFAGAEWGIEPLPLTPAPDPTR